MQYHPFIGVTIFLIAMVISFVLGKFYIKKKQEKISKFNNQIKVNLPKGEITSPDAPWLDNK